MHVVLHNIVSAKTFKDRSKSEVASRSARFDKINSSGQGPIFSQNQANKPTEIDEKKLRFMELLKEQNTLIEFHKKQFESILDSDMN